MSNYENSDRVLLECTSRDSPDTVIDIHALWLFSWLFRNLLPFDIHALWLFSRLFRILVPFNWLILFKSRALPFIKERYLRNSQKYWRNLKIFFSRTTEPISTKLGTKHPWVKGIQVCSNDGSCPFPRGDNYEIAKIHWRN